MQIRPKFKKRGKRYLPLGTLKGRKLDSAIREWVQMSIIPFVNYLENEFRRELKLPKNLSSFELCCSHGLCISACSGEDLVNQLAGSENWPPAESVDCTIYINCTIDADHEVWTEAVSFGLHETADSENGTYWITYVQHHYFSLEEQLPLRKAQAIVEEVLLGLRIQSMITIGREQPDN